MDLERLAAQNPWWRDKEEIKNDDKVMSVLSTGEKVVFPLAQENLVLIGPRQLGKTTALKYDIYKRIVRQGIDSHSLLYYSFDTARRFEEITEVLDTFVVGNEDKTFVYLDEVSFVEGWQRAIKLFLDSGNASNTTLYVTGSSSINLKKELMPGRKIKFSEFLPLSFRDFLMGFATERLKLFLEKNKAESFRSAIEMTRKLLPYFKEIEKWFGLYMEVGGYPDAIFDYISKGRTSDMIYDIHWNAFVSDVSKSGKSVEIATAIIYGLIESYSSKVNLSSIARIQGVKSHVTVREYIETFEDLFLSKSIFPISGKKYVFRKERKVYFSDPFLYNLFARKLNLLDKERESKIVEGILFGHLYRFVNRGKALSEPKTSVGFYSGKREIDFVIGDFGFEAKWQNDVKPSDFPNVSIKNKVLLSKRAINKEDDVQILPLPLFLSVL